MMVQLQKQTFIGLCILVLTPGFGISIAQENAAPRNQAARSETSEQQPRDDQAESFFNQGKQQLAAGEVDTAIESLQSALKLKPNNAQYHHKLGQAYLAKKDFMGMWQSYRLAVSFDPSNRQFVRDFLQTWKLFDAKGVLNNGATFRQVEKELGEPDLRKEIGAFVRYIYGFIAVDFKNNRIARLVDLRGIRPEHVEPVEEVKWGFDPAPFKENHRIINSISDQLEWVPSGETVQDWKKMLAVQRFANFASRDDVTPKTFMDVMQARLLQQAPNAKWFILDESPNDVIYHWRVGKSDVDANQEAQHEVARIVRGRRDFYRFAYTSKTEKLSNAELQKWKKRLAGIQLVPLQNNDTDIPPEVDDRLYRRIAWDLGFSLSYAILLNGQHGPQEEVDKKLERAQALARAIKLAIPTLPERTDNQTRDLVTAFGFLLNNTAKPMQVSIRKNQGIPASASFELAIKSNLLTVLYSPEDNQAATAAVSAIKKTASVAEIPSEIIEPLIKAVADRADRKAVLNTIVEMQQRVEASLPVKPPQEK